MRRKEKEGRIIERKRGIGKREKGERERERKKEGEEK